MPNPPEIMTLANDLGGTMRNLHAVEDATTDLDAGFDNNSRCAVAMFSHTRLAAWARVTLAASTGALVLVDHDALWGKLQGAPALARTSIGLFTFTWPTEVNDEIIPPNAHTVNLKVGLRPNFKGATLFHGQLDVTSANVATLRVWDAAGSLSDAVGTDVYLLVL